MEIGDLREEASATLSLAVLKRQQRVFILLKDTTRPTGEVWATKTEVLLALELQLHNGRIVSIYKTHAWAQAQGGR